MKSAENRRYEDIAHQPTAANDNIELQIQSLTSAELLTSALENPEMIERLYLQIQDNQKLQSRLGLEGMDEIQIKLQLGKTIESLTNLSLHLKDVIELVAITLVNPKGLIRPNTLSKTSKVIAFNDVIIEEAIDKLTSFRTSENKLVSLAGHLAKISLSLQPNNSATKLTSYLLRGIGLVTDTEYENMKESVNGLEMPNLTLWVVISTLKNNPELAKSIYDTVLLSQETLKY